MGRKKGTKEILSEDPLSKSQLAKKYNWSERHSDRCECVYCVLVEKLSREKEAKVCRTKMRAKK